MAGPVVLVAGVARLLQPAEHLLGGVLVLLGGRLGQLLGLLGVLVGQLLPVRLVALLRLVLLQEGGQVGVDLRVLGDRVPVRVPVQGLVDQLVAPVLAVELLHDLFGRRGLVVGGGRSGPGQDDGDETPADQGGSETQHPTNSIYW